MTRQDRRDARDLLRQRLRGRVDDESVSQALLSAVDYPHARSRARVRSRLISPARLGRRWGRLAMGVAVVALVGTTALASRVLLQADPDQAPVTVEVAEAPTPVQPVTVELSGDRVRSEPVPGVVLVSTGDGRVEGTAAGVVVEWHAGEVVLEVDPSCAVPVEVHTREATVRVVGTRFAVDRSAAGTSVRVERGAVQLTCVGGLARPLVAPEGHLCGPVSAGALLGQASAPDAPPPEVLAAAEAGLALAGPGSPLRGELLYWRAIARVELRHPGAMAAIDEALADPYCARSGELEALRRGSP